MRTIYVDSPRHTQTLFMQTMCIDWACMKLLVYIHCPVGESSQSTKQRRRTFKMIFGMFFFLLSCSSSNISIKHQRSSSSQVTNFCTCLLYSWFLFIWGFALLFRSCSLLFFNQSLLNEFKFQYMVSEVGIQWRLSAHAFRDTYMFSRKLNVCLCLHCTKLCPWKYTWALSGGICISWHRDCDWERYWKTEGLQIMIDIGAVIIETQRGCDPWVTEGL